MFKEHLTISMLRKLLAAGKKVRLDWVQHGSGSSRWFNGVIHDVQFVPATSFGLSAYYEIRSREGFEAGVERALRLTEPQVSRAKIRRDEMRTDSDSWVFSDRDRDPDDEA